MRSLGRWRERLAGRNPLPTGASTVGLWIGFTGLTAYGFLAFGARALGEGPEYSALSALWALGFIVGPGFFLPVEQEVARALAHRRAQGLGSAPVVRRAAFLGLGLAGLLSLITLVAGPWLADQLFAGSWTLVLALVLILFGYAVEHLVRGTLGGNQRFGTYGLLFATEGTFRLVGAAVLAGIGVTLAGPFGLVVGIGPFVGSAVAARRERGLLQPGPHAEWSELTQALAYLLVGSVLGQSLVNSVPIATQVLAGPGEDAVAGTLLNGLLVARVPLFFFQAVQASLVPELSGHRGAGRHAELVRGVRRILAVVVVIGVSATIGAALFGPWVVRTFFGEEFRLSGADMAMLAGASGLIMLTLALVQVLIALSQYRLVAALWVAGAVAFAVGIWADVGDLTQRVETAFLLGTGVAALCALALVLRELNRESRARSGHT